MENAPTGTQTLSGEAIPAGMVLFGMVGVKSEVAWLLLRKPLARQQPQNS
jgi:hypothetical protein